MTVRGITGGPDDHVIVNHIATGWPHDSFAADNVRSCREPNENFVHYIGF